MICAPDRVLMMGGCPAAMPPAPLKLSSASLLKGIVGQGTLMQLHRLNCMTALRMVTIGLRHHEHITPEICELTRERVFLVSLYHWTGQHSKCHMSLPALEAVCPASKEHWCNACLHGYSSAQPCDTLAAEATEAADLIGEILETGELSLIHI